MKPMQGIKNLGLFVAVLTFTLFPSCFLEDDDIVNPVDARAKFIGEWKVNEDCTRANYMVDIQLDPGNSTQVLLDNFGNPGPGSDAAVGLVVSNTIKISSQNIGQGWTVAGEGTYQVDGTIHWTYTLIIGGYTENCSAVYSR